VSSYKWPSGAETDIENLKACVGVGWGDIITRLVADLEGLGWDRNICQIKEKYGTLRFYIGGGTTEIFDRIHQAEEESSKTCEVCGQPGTLDNEHYWVVTNCEECRANRHAKKEAK
jgi:hypothetical protein